MTCIVGIVEKKDGRVWIGGDSAGVAGYGLTARADEKVFRNGEFVIGFTSSFRMGQILRYCFTPPPIKTWDIWRYMVSEFIPASMKAMRDHGWERKAKDDGWAGGEIAGGTFLVGVRGQLFKVEGDFQVGIARDGWAAVGCGDDLARGAIWASSAAFEHVRLQRALECAAALSAGVCAPFIMLSDRGDELRWGEPRGEVA